jgi:hypothetical protein
VAVEIQVSAPLRRPNQMVAMPTLEIRVGTFAVNKYPREGPKHELSACYTAAPFRSHEVQLALCSR